MILARLFVIIGGLVVLALTAALVAPYFIDWTNYRADFEREASRVLGRQVTVEGSATARLLPFPSVTFSEIRVAGAGAEPAMTVETFSMDAELAPFLRGEVLIFDMRLVRPKALISVSADGKLDWAIRPAAPFDAQHIVLESMTVTEGSIALSHAVSGRTHLISEINADVSARTLAGPWRIDGSARLDGLPTELSIATGAPDETGKARLRLRAVPARYGVVLEAEGVAGLENGAASYSGAFKLNPVLPETASLRDGDGKSLPVRAAGEPPEYRLAGEFSLDHLRLAVPEFRLETGPVDNPYTAEGSADLELGGEPRFAINATGAQIRFDEHVGDASAGGGGLTLEARIAALEEALAALPRPTIPGTVDVNLPAVVAGDTTIRDVRLSAQPSATGWTLETLSALLPGRTTLEASGDLTLADADMQFSGSLLLAVGQPSGFAAWLSRDIDDSIRRIPSAGFAAKVDISEERQTFSDLELVLGDARFRGRLDNVSPPDAEPAMTLSLDGGALDVEGLMAFASLFVSERGESRFAGRNLDMEVKAGPVSVAGLTAGTVDTALRLKEGRLEIDRLSIADVAGASISATGKIADFPGRPTGNLDASIVAADLAPLISVLAARFPENIAAGELQKRSAAYPGLFENAEIDLMASAAPEEGSALGLAVSAHGSAGGTAFNVTFSGRGEADRAEAAEIDLSLTAQNDDAAALFALYGLPALPLGMAGAGETELVLAGSLAEGLKTAWTLDGDGARASFEGVVEQSETSLSARGRATLDAEDLEPWLVTLGAGLPGFGQGLPASLAAEIAWSGGAVRFDGLSGSLAGQAIAADLVATVREGVPHLTGELALDTLALELAGGLLFGEAALEADGEGWPETAFANASRSPVTAELALQARSVTASGETMLSDAGLTLRITPDSMAVSDLKGALHGGTLSGLVEFRNNEGTGLFSGQLSLAGADLAGLAATGGLGGAADISASLSASGKSLSAFFASLSGSGTARARNLVLEKLDQGAFPEIIARADAAGRDINAAAVEAFAPAVVTGGQFAAGQADLAFTVAAGVLRTPPLTLKAPGATLTAEARIDVGGLTGTITGEIAYEAGDEALVGSAPVLGFTLEGPLGAMQRRFDTAPLAQFLTQRALEIEQARVEAMQAELLEKQRLRREVRYYTALQEERARREAERRQAEEAARLRAIEEARLRAEEAARLQAEEAARREAEEAARREAEETARRQAEETARREAEEAARREAEEAARREAEEAARLQAEETARRQAEEAARLQAEETARQEAEAAARQQAEEAARQAAEEVAQREAEETARREAEEAERQRQELIEFERARAAAEAERAAAEAAGRGALPGVGSDAPAGASGQQDQGGGFLFDRLLRSLQGSQ